MLRSQSVELGPCAMLLSTFRTAVVAACSLGILASELAAQKLPEYCDNLHGTPKEMLSFPTDTDPYSSQLPLFVRDVLERAVEIEMHGEISASNVAFSVLKPLWAADSLALEAALAFLVGEGGYFSIASGQVSRLAAVVYRELSGRPEPLVAVVSRPGNASRWTLALSAMTERPATRKTRAVMLRLACNSRWLVAAWRSDAEYAAHATGTFESVLAAEAILNELYRLMPDLMVR